MKKKFFVSILMMLAVAGAKADEGMWTLMNLPQAVYEQMVAEGFSLSYDDLYKSPDAIKNYVVNFSGYCSGVVVSPNGLVFTNHHCGFESIRSHSTVEHDYMLNGFFAKSYEEELPNKDMFVAFMREEIDVTPKLMALGIDDMERMDAEVLIDSLEQAMNDSVKKIDKTLSVEIKPFYERNAYYATVNQIFGDLRLVFAIPKSMGKFGGETDNWMWPRQTCDFSVFRIYADPETNGPAEYSERNVPYHPASWAPVSMQGYKDGDFSMTLGYPGSTSRYLSSFGIREMRDAENSTRVQVRGVKQEVMKRHMDASEAVRIKYDSKYAQSSNYWKNSMGMNKCIDSIGIIRHKEETEAKIHKFQQETGFLKDKLNLDKMKECYAQRFDADRAWMYFTETFWRTNELTSRALAANMGMVELKGPEDNLKKQYFEFPDNSEEWDEALDKEVLAVLLKNYREHVDAKYLPEFFQTIDRKFKGNYKAYVDHLFKKSLLMKKGAKIYPAKKSFQKDLGVQMGIDLATLMGQLRGEMSESSVEIDKQEKYLCAAKLRMEEDLPHYSDANFSMRMSYGQVKEYLLGGKPSGWYTTAESLLEKMKRVNENEEYFAEPIMHELFSQKDYGKYTDPRTGKFQLCFLTTNDITGGNSGSPMFNGKGELMSDINFDSRLARCIGVDIRYVLFMMDQWGHADRLIREISPR